VPDGRLSSYLPTVIRRHVATALSLLLLGQLALFGASPLCRAGTAGAGDVAMAAALAHGSHGPTAPDAPETPHEREHGGATDCAATSMCAVVMLAPAVEGAGVDGVTPASRIPGAVLRWTSVSRAPDLPPPRA
jgi:hypothetical protein